MQLHEWDPRQCIIMICNTHAAGKSHDLFLNCRDQMLTCVNSANVSAADVASKSVLDNGEMIRFLSTNEQRPKDGPVTATKEQFD